MSLFAMLDLETHNATDTTPETVLAIAFPGMIIRNNGKNWIIEAGAVTASARCSVSEGRPPEMFPFNPSISIYFTIAKTHASEARDQLAAALRNVLTLDNIDLAFYYFDVPVILRSGGRAHCVKGYEDMLPNGPEGWEIRRFLDEQ